MTREVIDWDTVKLGREPDEDIAQRLGCDVTTVCRQRQNRGIARMRKSKALRGEPKALAGLREASSVE